MKNYHVHIISLLLIVGLGVSQIGKTENSPQRTENGWFHTVPVQINTNSIDEPVTVHHKTGTEKQSVWTDDGYVDVTVWDDGTVYYEGSFNKFSCRTDSTGYIYSHGWNIYYECATHHVFATHTAYPTEVADLNEKIITSDIQWISFSEGTITPNFWWLQPQQDGSLLFISPLGDVGEIPSGNKILQVGESKIFLHQTNDGWRYAENN